MKFKIMLMGLILFLSSSVSFSQNAKELVEKSDKVLRGSTTYSEITLKTIRPSWTKDMSLKSWTRGTKYNVSIVTSPAKERGTVFLMRDHEVWNYVPSIERSIKLPPSMMMQNWMGTDMTNDDLVKQSSIVTDYSHKLLESESVNGLECWKIELTPKEDAAVVWGKIILWIDKEDYMQMKVEFYDEDEYLVNKLIARQPKVFDGRKVPSIIEYIPVEEEGQKTVIEYKVLKFDIDIDDQYFSPQFMKRLRY